MTNETIKIDIVSDIACPWCYVGKRRLEKALKLWKGNPVEITWHPFQLDPTIPKEGINRRTYLKNKFGSDERINALLENLTSAGKGEGIEFDFNNRELSINTLPLHQLLHVAGQEGFQNELKERFLKAYFEEDVELHTAAGLSVVMAEFGWSPKKVDQVINNNELAEIVQKEIAYFQKLGVSGVPFFIVNNKYALNGAQPPEVFLEMLESVASKGNVEVG